jgi:hypothetical protein
MGVTPGDLTIILLTVNLVPDEWAEYHKRVLLAAAGDSPIITLSRLPMSWGLPRVRHELQIMPEDYAERVQNVYVQIRRGAEMATTPYIAIAEDDCLYPASHFSSFRPDLKTFAFNHTRWCMFSWQRRHPFYYHMPSDANCLVIAPRELVIEKLGGLEVPDISRRVMHRLVEPAVYFNTYEPILCFYHDKGNDPLERHHHKKPWPVQAFDIPVWGKAKHAIQLWK